FAWLGTSLGFGVAFGSAIAGNIIDAANAKTAMLLPAGCAILGAVIALSLLKLSTRSGRATRSGWPRTAAGCAWRNRALGCVGRVHGGVGRAHGGAERARRR